MTPGNNDITTRAIFGGLGVLGLLFIVTCGNPGKEDPEEFEIVDPPGVPTRPINIPTLLNCPRATKLTYANFGEGFMLNYCTTCHTVRLALADRMGAPERANLDTGADIVQWRALILDKAAGGLRAAPTTTGTTTGTTNTTTGTTNTTTGTTNTTTGTVDTETGAVATVPVSMPPSGNVPKWERLQLAEWLNCGAPGAR